jgi:hypothetical protein
MFGQAFDWLRKWIALTLAFLIQVVIVLSATDPGAEEWVVAVLNALLVFSAAMGLNESGNTLSRRWGAGRQIQDGLLGVG